MNWEQENKQYQPLVSVVIPVYNGGNYLREAIDSALEQTYPNVEIIVVNDGSKDNGETRNIALSYGSQIRYIEKENGGSSSALNAGIKSMRGEWFSWLSHDDLYAPNKIEEQIKYLNYTENVCVHDNVIFSSDVLINAEGKIIRPFNKKKEQTISDYIKKIDKKNEYLISKPTEFVFHGCSCLVHRTVFDKVGMFDESLRLLNDYDLWYRIYIAGFRIHYIPQPLVFGRVHSKQISRKIGFSYHNLEQDMYWKRSLNWLLDNHSENKVLFINYGKNAYQKTRIIEGDYAFAYIKKKYPTLCWKLDILSAVIRLKAYIRSLVKSIYLSIKI